MEQVPYALMWRRLWLLCMNTGTHTCIHLANTVQYLYSNFSASLFYSLGCGIILCVCVFVCGTVYVCMRLFLWKHFFILSPAHVLSPNPGSHLMELD